ncbi:MAG TPA: NAD(P)-dependent oxidoreductase [Bryobacteraceae bacterium]|jgi:3-hydroxyisobutyrate dehydrogenase/2-hydroxy-3-oxopropionate reductase|nr:NAD(P)-dependent oxidoreductase [Bryobacteraceae bacterium]
MAKLAFLGLGAMGYPMARNLMRAGHEVALWSKNGDKPRALAAEEKGGAPCATPAEAAANAECIFLCVGDTEMSRETILGENGVIHGAKAGAVVADCSTISPEESRKIGAALQAKGIEFLDAPCTGSTPGATGGTLTFMIGGNQAVFEDIKPFLDPMGKRLYYCGNIGMGLQAKLTQNLILANLCMAFNEGMVLAVKGGVDPNLMLQILDNSAAKSGLISYKAPFVLRRDFTPNFMTKWMDKDISLMLENGEQLGVPLFLTSLTHQLFQSAIAGGYGEQDFCSSISMLEKLTGVIVQSPEKSQ